MPDPVGGGWHQAQTLPCYEISQTGQEHLETQPWVSPKKLSKPSIILAWKNYDQNTTAVVAIMMDCDKQLENQVLKKKKKKVFQL